MGLSASFAYDKQLYPFGIILNIWLSSNPAPSISNLFTVSTGNSQIYPPIGPAIVKNVANFHALLHPATAPKATSPFVIPQ